MLVIQNPSLRPEVPRLLELVQRMVSIARREPYNVPFYSSKQLFHMVKSILKRYGDTGIVRWLFREADPEALRRVMDPLFERLERAVAAQVMRPVPSRSSTGSGRRPR